MNKQPEQTKLTPERGPTCCPWYSSEPLLSPSTGNISVNETKPGKSNHERNTCKVGPIRKANRKILFPSARLMLRHMHLTTVPESSEAKYWVPWLSFDVWQTWIRAMKPALEFVILCSNRWLKIEVAARKKSVFPTVSLEIEPNRDI